MEVTGTLCVSNEPKKYIYIRERRVHFQKRAPCGVPGFRKKKRGASFFFEIRNPLFSLLSFFIYSSLNLNSYIQTGRMFKNISTVDVSKFDEPSCRCLSLV